MATQTPTADLSGGPVLLSFSLATASFALATTFVRFCVRAGIYNHIGADDYVMGIATLVALIGTIFGIVESTTTDPSRALEFDVLGQPWFLMSATLAKISICLFFISLLGRARQWRILLGILVFLMAAVNFSFSLTVNLQCRPLEKLWRPTVAGVCWDPSVQLNFGYFQGAFSLFSWFFLAVFPVLIVRDMRIDGNKTWPFYVTAVLSFASGIFAIVKTADASQTSNVSVYTSHHFYASLMANLEQNLGLIAANVLTLGPLFSPSSRRNISASRSGASSNGKAASSRAGSTRPIASRSSSRASSRGGANSARSSIIDLKRTTHLIIEGPRRASLERSASKSSMRDRDFIMSEEEGEGEEYDLGEQMPRRMFSRSRNHRREQSLESLDLEAWPRGIIKTVSVEVVEEVNPDHVPVRSESRAGASGVRTESRAGFAPVVRSESRAGNANGTVAGWGPEPNDDRVSGTSGVEQDWETMLREGPPGR